MATDTRREEEQELALAAELQAALLPKRCPVACPHQVTAAKNRMSGRVGGDFYDFLKINDEQIALVIGDMVGHGVRAALLMAAVMGWFRSNPGNMSKPASVITDLNRMLIDLGNRVGTPMPFSIFYIVIDQPSGMGLFVNAGHPRPFLCDREKCATFHLGARNMLLGVEEFEPQEGCNAFEPGQRMVLYTDGITDAANAGGERFGQQRLGDLLNRSHALSPEQLAETLFHELDVFRGETPQFDDETVVVFDRV